MSNGIGKKLAGAAGGLLLAYAVVFAQSVWVGQEQKAKENRKPAQRAAVQQMSDEPSLTAIPAIESRQEPWRAAPAALV